MKRRLLALAKKEGTDSPAVQSILRALAIYLFFVATGVALLMELIRGLSNSWLPSCMADTDCRADVVAAANGDEGPLFLGCDFVLCPSALSC
eukprot:SAG11_NODE_6156_length_1375_cov_0.826019_2_plen_92_part_00